MKTRILVIDDDDGVRYSLQQMLSVLGYDVRSANGGEQGLAALEEFDPVFVITDMIMPDMDGVETITQIKKRKSDVKVIAMSGGPRLGNDDVLVKARKAGADLAVLKPFELDELTSFIRSSLSLSEINRSR